MSRQSFRTGIGIIALVFAALILTGVKQFHVWQQIYYQNSITQETKLGFWSSFFPGKPSTPKIFTRQQTVSKRASITIDSDMIPVVEPIAVDIKYTDKPRYYLMRPIIIIANVLGVRYDSVFSWVVLVLLLGAWGLLAKTLQLKKFAIQHGLSLVMLVSLLTFSLTLNGRMIWTFFSMALLLYMDASTRETNKPLSVGGILLAVSVILWTAAVSTGTFAITYSLMWIWAGCYFAENQRVLYLPRILLCSYLSLFFPLFLSSVFKNLAYFGGGFSALWYMLAHGLGRYMIHPVVLSSMLIVLLVCWYFRNHFKKASVSFATLLIASGLAGGLYGFSTMMIAIPPLMLLSWQALLSRYAQ